MSYLRQNSKMAVATVPTWQFSIPAVATCPGAAACKAFCFALSEQRRYPSAAAYRERALAATKAESFVKDMVTEVTDLAARQRKRGVPRIAIRIHASGDFYSAAYAAKWIAIARACPEVSFYAYTKSHAIWRGLRKAAALAGPGLPKNLTVIFSMGSIADHLIDTENERHARIFADVASLEAAGYVRADEDDTAAWASGTVKIGLVLFGAVNKGKKALGL